MEDNSALKFMKRGSRVNRDFLFMNFSVRREADLSVNDQMNYV